MKDMESEQLLRDPQQKPDEKLFNTILNEQLYHVYEELQNMLSEIGLSSEWRYYNDGKSWLYKITYKKKTIAWLSLWKYFFKTSFYFTEKTRAGIMKLDIGDDLKSSFLKEKRIGKLIPLILKIDDPAKLVYFRRIAEYKMSLK